MKELIAVRINIHNEYNSVLQDYETAMAALQFAATDFRAERAWKHFAGTQEMLGVAAFLTGGRLADVAGHFREAFQRYTQPAGAHTAGACSPPPPPPPPSPVDAPLPDSFASCPQIRSPPIILL